MKDDIAGHGHGILQIPLNLIQDVFRRPSEQDGTGFGFSTFSEEGEIFIPNLLNLE